MEEQEVQKQESNTTTDYLNSTVGENEGAKGLDPKPVMIASVQIQTHNKDNKKMDNELVQVHCKHPDKDDLIKLTQIQHIKGSVVVNTALFISADDEGKFMKDSGIAILLAFKNVKTLKELESLQMDTIKESETSKYMALKCY